MQVEMSIIKRLLQNWRDRQTQHTRCLYCRRANDNQTVNEWFSCENLTCGRRYQLNVHDQETEYDHQEPEQIMSPQIMAEGSGASPDSFRLIQIHAVQLKMGSHVTRFNNYTQSRRVSHLVRWPACSTGSSDRTQWTVQCEVSGVVQGTGVAGSKTAAREEAARQALIACGFTEQ
ncbi:hypothetical protein B0H17DRAFT_1060072 [Mycena rosella]|uniref:DRBM domain-containing protein n=1 Tax=Mycena rosella TaxID=1033263 RepID=A0AAD7DM25_MYCRO|nr:hypothetical protein B0H17DRAFT_1060072 [Mycena rosella]